MVTRFLTFNDLKGLDNEDVAKAGVVPSIILDVCVFVEGKGSPSLIALLKNKALNEVRVRVEKEQDSPLLGPMEHLVPVPVETCNGVITQPADLKEGIIVPTLPCLSWGQRRAVKEHGTPQVGGLTPIAADLRFR